MDREEIARKNARSNELAEMLIVQCRVIAKSLVIEPSAEDILNLAISFCRQANDNLEELIPR